MTKPLPDVLNAIVLGPDDRLVIVVDADISDYALDGATAALKDRGFSDRVLIVAGAEALAVLRGEVSR